MKALVAGLSLLAALLGYLLFESASLAVSLNRHILQLQSELAQKNKEEKKAVETNLFLIKFAESSFDYVTNRLRYDLDQKDTTNNLLHAELIMKQVEIDFLKEENRRVHKIVRATREKLTEAKNTRYEYGCLPNVQPDTYYQYVNPVVAFLQ